MSSSSCLDLLTSMSKHWFTQVPRENPQYLISDNAHNLVVALPTLVFSAMRISATPLCHIQASLWKAS